MASSRYYSWAVIDVENWSSRRAVSGSRIQNALRVIERRALKSLNLDWADIGRQPRGDGAILALPGEIPKEKIATRFVEQLREAVLEHDMECDPEDSIRIRLTLNAGDALDGDGEWAGQPVILACRLVDSSVLRRVLAASTGSPMALMVSAQWYDAVIREGYASGDGYREVFVRTKAFSGPAWVQVPGRSQPAGLLAEDDPDSQVTAEAAGDQNVDGTSGPRPTAGNSYRSDNSRNQGLIVQGSTVTGDVSFGNTYHGETGHTGRAVR